MTRQLPGSTFTVTRLDLIRYAGASGDFNPIHWSDRSATDAGLPEVIAHGMLTMALAGRVVTGLTGDPGRILDYETRFIRPVLVPNDDSGIEITVTGTITDPHAAADPETSADRTARIDLQATNGTGIVAETTIVLRWPTPDFMP